MSMFEEPARLKPNPYPPAEVFHDTMVEGMWTVKNFSFNSDVRDVETRMSYCERGVIERTLSALVQVEVCVKKFWSQLGDNLPHQSLSELGSTFAFIETIHSKAYAKLLERLGWEDRIDYNLSNSAVLNGRKSYLKKYLDKTYKDDRKQYLYALILFSMFTENVSLFSQFYIVQWMNRNLNVLKDTAMQTSYTRREETIHAMAGFWIINTLRKEHPELFDAELEQRIYDEAKVAYFAETQLNQWMLGTYEANELSVDILNQFAACRLNESLKAIGYKEIFIVDEDLVREFEWFEVQMKGGVSVDFFYTHSIDYSKCDTVYEAEELW